LVVFHQLVPDFSHRLWVRSPGVFWLAWIEKRLRHGTVKHLRQSGVYMDRLQGRGWAGRERRISDAQRGPATAEEDRHQVLRSSTVTAVQSFL